MTPITQETRTERLRAVGRRKRRHNEFAIVQPSSDELSAAWRESLRQNAEALGLCVVERDNRLILRGEKYGIVARKESDEQSDA